MKRKKRSRFMTFDEPDFDLTIFTVISPRRYLTERFLDHLEAIDRPANTEIVLYDNSYDSKINKLLVERLASFPDRSCFVIPPAGLQPSKILGRAALVRCLHRILFNMPLYTRGKHIMTMEDDVFVPSNAYTELAKHIKGKVVASYGMYPGRLIHRQTKLLIPAVWAISPKSKFARVVDIPKKPTRIRGGGWGCLVLDGAAIRGLELEKRSFRPPPEEQLSDIFVRSGLEAVLCPHIKCQHQVGEKEVLSFE